MKLRKSSVQQIPLRTLALDARAQRRVIGAKVRKLVKNFDPDKLGIFTVSVRDGQAYIMDGQHRWRAAVELGHGDMKVKCHVYRDLTLEQEAALFLSLNDSAPVSAIDKFNVGLTASDPDCVGTRDVLSGFGCGVAANSADGFVKCPDTLLRIYRQDGGDLLEETFGVITEAWGTRSDALEQIVVQAVARVLGRYNGELNRNQLVKKLSKYPGGASGLIGNARGLSKMKPGLSVGKAAAESIIDTYNKGRRSGALPPL